MVIYSITNLVNGRLYIGQTTKLNPEKRWTEHKNEANRNISNQYIHKAMRKHGIDNFVFDIIETCPDTKSLNEAEINWIEKLDTFGSHGYNLTIGGNNTTGYRHTLESRQKMSTFQQQRINTPEHNTNISKSQKGKKGIHARNTKKVIQIDKNTGEEIACWFTMNYAYEELNIQSSGISKACKGQRKTAGGYIWKYAPT